VRLRDQLAWYTAGAIGAVDEPETRVKA
jgi:hypothetical protein